MPRGQASRTNYSRSHYLGGVHRNKERRLMSELGQTRSCGDLGSMSGLPETGHGWAIYEYLP
jgi:hypothetical protein